MTFVSNLRHQFTLILFLLVLLLVVLIFISYKKLHISVHEDWKYELAYTDIESVSGIAIDGDTLYATQETRNHNEQLIAPGMEIYLS